MELMRIKDRLIDNDKNRKICSGRLHYRVHYYLFIFNNVQYKKVKKRMYKLKII